MKLREGAKCKNSTYLLKLSFQWKFFNKPKLYYPAEIWRSITNLLFYKDSTTKFSFCFYLDGSLTKYTLTTVTRKIPLCGYYVSFANEIDLSIVGERNISRRSAKGNLFVPTVTNIFLWLAIWVSVTVRAFKEKSDYFQYS